VFAVPRSTASCRSGPNRRIVVSLDEPKVVAAADGDPVELRSPLEIECLPRALRVLVPQSP
jgi:diacylglycerol kinase family enzyme